MPVARSFVREGARHRALSRVVLWVALAALCTVFFAAAADARTERRPRSQPAPVVVEIHDGGFHWLDAAIGAAAALGLACVAGVGFLVRGAAPDSAGRASV